MLSAVYTEFLTQVSLRYPDVKVLLSLKYPSDKPNAEVSAKFMSWWPTANIWDDCGMHVGYWTESAEAWFCQRRKDIRAGAKPLNAHQWRHQLKFSRTDTHRVLSAARLSAEQSLPKISKS